MNEKSNWFDSHTLSWGIAAGLGMSLFLVILQSVSLNNTVALKFFKYIFLAIFIFYGLSKQKVRLGENYRFKNGMMAGGWITFYSGIVLAIMNVLLFVGTDSLAFDKFTETGTTLGSVGLISGVLFFEVMIFGLILTFIWLQFIKPKRSKVR